MTSEMLRLKVPLKRSLKTLCWKTWSASWNTWDSPGCLRDWQTAFSDVPPSRRRTAQRRKSRAASGKKTVKAPQVRPAPVLAGPEPDLEQPPQVRPRRTRARTRESTPPTASTPMWMYLKLLLINSGIS